MEKKPRKNSLIIFEDKKNITKGRLHNSNQNTNDSVISGSPVRLGNNKSDSAIAIPISAVSHHRHINPGSSLDILVAEDNDLSYMILKYILEKLDVNIHHAQNGIEVIEMVKSIPHIDLILMDIKMPKLNGIEATREIRKISPEMPVIAISAFHDDRDKLISFQAGCDDFISKPIDSSLLLSKIIFWNF